MLTSIAKWLIGAGVLGAGVVAAGTASASEPPPPTPATPRREPKYRNNPGNIRFIADPARRWQGMLPVADKGYGQFDTAANGVRAAYQQFAKYQRDGLKSLSQMMTKWAPAHENPTSGYIKFLADRLKVSADAPFDLGGQRAEFLQGVFRFEQGYDTYTLQEIQQWAK